MTSSSFWCDCRDKCVIKYPICCSKIFLHKKKRWSGRKWHINYLSRISCDVISIYNSSVRLIIQCLFYDSLEFCNWWCNCNLATTLTRIQVLGLKCTFLLSSFAIFFNFSTETFLYEQKYLLTFQIHLILKEKGHFDFDFTQRSCRYVRFSGFMTSLAWISVYG